MGVSVVYLAQPDGGWDPAPMKYFLSPVPIDPDSQREAYIEEEIPGVHSTRAKDHPHHLFKRHPSSLLTNSLLGHSFNSIPPVFIY